MARSVTRTINLYALHARSGDDLVDYGGFFEALRHMPTQETVRRVTRELNFAVRDISRVEGRLRGRLVAGTPEEIPVYFDERTGELLRGATRPGRWLARTARFVVDPDARYFALEMTRSGITSLLIERYFARIAEALHQSAFRFDLSPIHAPSLLAEINGLVRIREASVTATRPNFDWEDAGDQLAELAALSGGEEAAAVVKAPRGGSLERERGIIGIIQESLAKRTPNLRDFRVVGRPEDSSKDITISSERHQARGFVDYSWSDPVAMQDEAVFHVAENLMDSTLEEIEARASGEGPGALSERGGVEQ